MTLSSDFKNIEQKSARRGFGGKKLPGVGEGSFGYLTPPPP